MYQYTVFATIAKKEIELKTFFDDLDEKPMEKAKALVEANKGKFRSLRIEKRSIQHKCVFRWDQGCHITRDISAIPVS